jgi:hypothetical protein
MLAAVLLGLLRSNASATPTPTPTGCSVTSPWCGGVVFGGPPTDFIVNLSDPADPVTVQGSDLTVNGTPADDAVLSNGDITIDFIFNTSPAVEGQNTMHIAAGAFNCGNGPVLEFTCMFTYHASVPTPPEASPTPTPSPTLTPTPTATPRPVPTPRPRPSPHSRPIPPQ